MITGQCACAAVKYQVSGNLKDLCHCHCSVCRRIHGAAFVSWGGVLRDEFEYLSGEDNLRSYPFSEKADSVSCQTCSSVILVDFKPEPHMLYITTGAAEGDLDCSNAFHQFVGSKASWYEITDDLPQYQAWPPDDDPTVDP
jgi:hypothetical protein